MKVLIIRFGDSEEVLFSTPIIRTLKTEYTEAEIDYLTDATLIPLLKNNPYLNSIVTANELDKKNLQQYTHIIDLQGSKTSRRIAKRTNARVFTYDALNLKKWLYTQFKVDKLPNKHITDSFYELVGPLGIKADALGLDFFLNKEDKLPADLTSLLSANDFVVFSLTAAYATRQLPLTRMIELCDKMNRPVVLIGEEKDKEKAEQLSSFFSTHPDNEYEEGLAELGKRTSIINYCGKLNLNEQALLIKKARYIFTHDSLHMAVASAFQKPIFSLWGNTTPKMGKYPYRTKFLILEKNGLSCRPCSTKGYNQCPKQHFKCMHGITFDFYLP